MRINEQKIPTGIVDVQGRPVVTPFFLFDKEVTMTRFRQKGKFTSIPKINKQIIEKLNKIGNFTTKLKDISRPQTHTAKRTPAQGTLR